MKIILMLMVMLGLLTGCGGDSGGSSGSGAGTPDSSTNDENISESGDGDGDSEGDGSGDAGSGNGSDEGTTELLEFVAPPNTPLLKQDFEDPNFYATDSYADESEVGYYDDRVRPELLTREERIEKIALLQDGVWTTGCRSYDDNFNMNVSVSFSDFAMPENFNFDNTDYLVLRAQILTYDVSDVSCTGTPYIRDVSGAYRISNAVTANNGQEVLDVTIRLFETVDFTYTQGSQVYYLIADWNDWQMHTSEWLVNDTNFPSERGGELNYIDPYLKVIY